VAEVYRADFFDFWLELRLDSLEQTGHESRLSLSDEHELLQPCRSALAGNRSFAVGFRPRLSSCSEIEPEPEPLPRPESDFLPVLLLTLRFRFLERFLLDELFDSLLDKLFDSRSYFFDDSTLDRLLVDAGRTFRYFRRCFR
jgi:hypothetical protein